MAYVYNKVNWEDTPSTNTPRNATNLGNMDTGIKENNNMLNGTKPMGSIVVDDVSCKNMFNENYYAPNILISDTGVETSNIGWNTSFYIPVNPSTNYTLSYVSSSTAAPTRISFYTSNKTFISRTTPPVASPYSFITPNNTEYIRISFATSDISNIQLELGSEATSFTSYKEFENNEIYSLAETRCGVWVDGKPLYRKVIDIGALPNNTTKYINHNISNIDIITNYYGVCKSSNNIHFKLPYTSVTTTGSIQVYCTNTQIAVQTDVDRSSYSGYIVIEYTKATSGTRSIETAEEENR